ncbi:helix-turn-helix transcriptional regulator [Roseateles sp. BYS180W]|uniref:Helix-turn-helix transcriptional regulator n=1 Tax=Roseateles rivi TaxID=3299028 RepID=A0ABW7FV74_9BURK
MDGVQGRPRAAEFGGRVGFYGGPERRRSSSERWWHGALDEIDLGLCVVGDGLSVCYANYAARAQLKSAGSLQMQQGRLLLEEAADQQRLEQAVSDAQFRGLRRLICLGRGDNWTAISVVPVTDNQGLAMLVLGKRRLCGALPIQAFAREYHLTSAELQVLIALCEGLPPREIAEQHGVAISTVRTQIASVRAKTNTESIRELVSMVAQLPPLMGVLRVSDGV